jgi:transcriptional regulator with XRE-family HTH domain
VQELLNERGRTAGQIGEIAGIPALKMAAIIDGAHDLRLPVLADLAAALEVRASHLAFAYALPPGAVLPTPASRPSTRRFDAREAAGRLGRAIRLARLLRGLGRSEIAAATPMDVCEIRRIETGRATSPRLADVHALAAALCDQQEETTGLLGALIALYADDEHARRRVISVAPELAGADAPVRST